MRGTRDGKVTYAAIAAACALVVAKLAYAGGGYLGVKVVDERLGRSPERSAVIEAVAPNSPAMLAGLTTGNVVAAADSNRILSAEELRSYISSKNPNDTIALVVIRDNGIQKITRKVTIKLTGGALAPGFF